MLTAFQNVTVLGAVSLGISAAALILFALAFAGANLAYFDPSRIDESDRALPVLIIVGPALHDARRAARNALRDAAITTAALLALILPAAAPKGATHV